MGSIFHLAINIPEREAEPRKNPLILSDTPEIVRANRWGALI